MASFFGDGVSLERSFLQRLKKSGTIRAGNRMNVSEIEYLHLYMKILSNLHEPQGECNLKEFSNITSSVNP